MVILWCGLNQPPLIQMRFIKVSCFILIIKGVLAGIDIQHLRQLTELSDVFNLETVSKISYQAACLQW